MARFFLGFLVASVLWGGAVFGLSQLGYATFGREPVDEVADTSDDDAADDGPDEAPDKKRRRRHGARSERVRPASGRSDNTSSRPLPQGEATTGDDLDWNGERSVDMAGGEGQLSGSQIEAGFDSAMSRIRRCLILVPAEGEVKGKLLFGMRVGSDGTPRAVNLSGPAVVTSGESGDCLRKAAQGIRFAKFNGPDMLFKYPVTLQ